MSTKCKNSTSSRLPALDIIRCTALFCVAGVHFFQRTGFYDITITGPRTYIMVLMRNIFFVSVPLFIMLSGYLMHKKEFSLSYYLKLIKTLAVYGVASFIIEIYTVLRSGTAFSPRGFINKLVYYSNCGYGWYIEMYIGLFMIIPFLNLIFNNLNEVQRRWLIVICLLFTTGPTLINRRVHFMPDWWTVQYPVLYYFLGAYFRQHPPKTGKYIQRCFSVVIFVVLGSYCYMRSYGNIYTKGPWQEYYGLLVIIRSVAAFCALLSFDYSFVNKTAGKILAVLSDGCLAAYLLSYIFDSVVYGVLNNAVSSPLIRLNYFAITVPLVYICSLGSGVLLDKAISPVARILTNYLQKAISSR